MRDAIGTLPQSNRLSAIEDRISQLANSIEESLSPQHAASLEQNRLQQIDERLDEISRAIIATSRAQRPDQDGARRLERIEGRLAELADQLATSATQQNSDALYRKLGELSSRIDGLSSGSALPDGVIDQLAHQINLLANQVGKVMENLSQSDYHAVEARLEAIGQKLEAAERRSEEPHPLVLDKIDRRFAELTERLDAQYATQHVDPSALHTLEGRIDDLSQQISLGLLQAPAYDGPGLDVKAIRSLEDQIANIAHHLAQPVAEIAELKPRLDSIERSIASNRETVLDAAREAAESAVARVLQHGSHNDSVIARQLAEDMKSLEALARNSDERNGKTFETVHDTLVKIVDRLARLEQDVAGRADGERLPSPIPVRSARRQRGHQPQRLRQRHLQPSRAKPVPPTREQTSRLKSPRSSAVSPKRYAVAAPTNPPVRATKCSKPVPSTRHSTPLLSTASWLPWKRSPARNPSWNGPRPSPRG